jgi:hypothetical protein
LSDRSVPARGAAELSAVVFEFFKGHEKAAGPEVENVMRCRNGCVGRSVPVKFHVNPVDLHHLAIHRGSAQVDAMQGQLRPNS